MPGNGSRDLAALAARLKAAGARDLRLQMVRGLKTGAAPLIPAVKEAALAKLPKAGGLNKQVAGQRVTVSVRTGARTASVRLTTSAPDTKQTDSGYVRHPVFARSYSKATGQIVPSASAGSHRPKSAGTRWVTQEIPQAEGWWSNTLAASAPIVTPALTAVLEKIAAQIQGEL